MDRTIPDRVLKRVLEPGRYYDQGEPDACWLWKRTLHAEGYGHIGWQSEPGRNRTGKAHRVVYEALVGPIPDGLHIDHLCRNRACVNPAHLEPVTPQENHRRGQLVRAANNPPTTHCKRGHEWATNGWVKKNGSRTCIACNREGRIRRKAAARVGVST